MLLKIRIRPSAVAVPRTVPPVVFTGALGTALPATVAASMITVTARTRSVTVSFPSSRGPNVRRDAFCRAYDPLIGAPTTCGARYRLHSICSRSGRPRLVPLADHPSAELEGVMPKRLPQALAVLLVASSPLAAETLSIDHSAVGCVVAGKFPALHARFAP